VGTYLQSHVVGMEEMAEISLAVKLRAALANDLTELEPPDHDHDVDHLSLLLEMPVTVVHWLPLPLLSPPVTL
jgi:hypothetical protein